MVDKINPYDVAALERSLNDSATRVSTIWVSFLIFSLYLLITAATVEHRQLFLAEPVKLPALNIDLPLWGFFFLTPIMFVIFHTYVLLQVLLLGRTAAAYNDAVNRAVKPRLANAVTRQRLVNTLFAQIFAGSPRERDGWLGWLLKAMAWVTLAIAPILILLVFQFAFLPYHSHLVTWAHRLLILVELVALFCIWPLVLDSRRDIGLQTLRQPIPLIVAFVFILLSWVVATFPGEPLVNVVTGRSLSSARCEQWFQNIIGLIDLRFDRLVVPGIDAVDDEKLARIVKGTSEQALHPFQSERTRNFRARNFACSDLTNSDLRRVDLTAAQLSGADLEGASIQGASLNRAILQDASFRFAKLQDASIEGANLQRASLQGAGLQGAKLNNTTMAGANLNRAKLQGASLDYAMLQGTTLAGAQLQGASLYHTQLQGADLEGAYLQVSRLSGAQLQGASLVGAQMQGSGLEESSLSHADLSKVKVWRAQDTSCQDAIVKDLSADPILEFNSILEEGRVDIPATTEEITKFIERSVAEIEDAKLRKTVSYIMRLRLTIDPKHDDTAENERAWRDCESASRKKPKLQADIERATFLASFVCNARESREGIASGIIRNWVAAPFIFPKLYPSLADGQFYARLARDLLGDDGKYCAATRDFDEPTKKLLRKAVVAVTEPSKSIAPEARMKDSELLSIWMILRR